MLLTFFLLILEFLFKFLVIGSAGTGKSCLLHHFIEKKCKTRNILPIDSIVLVDNHDNSLKSKNFLKCVLRTITVNLVTP